MVRPDSEFCCNGCEYVHRLIRDSGLEHYYDLRDRQINPVQAGALQPRDYTWLEARARDELGWSPEVPFDRGLALFLEWFDRERANGDNADDTTSPRSEV